MIPCAYPMVTFKLRNATGNTVPPMDEANEIIPKAVDRLLLNQWATRLITGPNMTPHETYKQPQQLETGSYWTREVAALTPTPKP
jgi:hypothetical protein